MRITRSPTSPARKMPPNIMIVSFMANPLLPVYNTRRLLQMPPENQMVAVDAHPVMDLGLFIARHASLGESPEWLRALLSPSVEAPLQSDDTVRASVRDMLRTH